MGFLEHLSLPAQCQDPHCKRILKKRNFNCLKQLWEKKSEKRKTGGKSGGVWRSFSMEDLLNLNSAKLWARWSSKLFHLHFLASSNCFQLAEVRCAWTTTLVKKEVSAYLTLNVKKVHASAAKDFMEHSVKKVRTYWMFVLRACMRLSVCVCVCVCRKEVPEKWQERQVTPVTLPIHSTKNNMPVSLADVCMCACDACGVCVCVRERERERERESSVFIATKTFAH